MKTNKTALILAIVAALLCITGFVYKYVRFREIDATILFAGVFIVSFAYSMGRVNRK